MVYLKRDSTRKKKLPRANSKLTFFFEQGRRYPIIKKFE